MDNEEKQDTMQEKQQKRVIEKGEEVLMNNVLLPMKKFFNGI